MSRYLSLLLFIGLIYWSCEENRKSVDGTDDEEQILIQKSAKRGLAFDLKNNNDFESIKEGVSWWYNWHWDTDAPADYHQNYQMEFIPMLWGCNNNNNQIDNIKNFIINHPEVKYLLVINEPNLIDQANCTPSQAAIEWLTYEQIKSDLYEQGRDIAIVDPAMTWGTMENY